MAPATAIRLPASAPTAVSSPETRSRSARDHWAAARTLDSSCSSESGSATTSRMPVCIAVRISSGVRVGGEQDHPDLGEARRDLAGDLHHGHGAERVVERDDVDVEPAQRARQLLGLRDALDDLELVALGRQRGRGAREVGVADGDQEPLAHWPSDGRRYTRCSASSSDSSPGRSSARRTSAANDSA